MQRYLSICHESNREPNYKTSKSTTNIDFKDRFNSCNDLNQEKQEIHICNLDRLGMPIPSISGKKILDQSTFKRLKDDAAVVTAEKRRMDKKLQIENDERLKNESVNRKKELQKYDTLYKTKGPKLTQVSVN